MASVVSVINDLSAEDLEKIYDDHIESRLKQQLKSLYDNIEDKSASVDDIADEMLFYFRKNFVKELDEKKLDEIQIKFYLSLTSVTKFLNTIKQFVREQKGGKRRRRRRRSSARKSRKSRKSRS